MQLNDDKTRTHVTLTSGTMVSHYRIIEKIGAGGMSLRLRQCSFRCRNGEYEQVGAGRFGLFFPFAKAGSIPFGRIPALDCLPSASVDHCIV